MNGQIGIRPFLPQKVTRLIVQIKCISTSAGSMDSKQKKLEALVQQEKYDTHNWSAALDTYKLFMRDRTGKRGGGAALCVRESFHCLEADNGNTVQQTV